MLVNNLHHVMPFCKITFPFNLFPHFFTLFLIFLVTFEGCSAFTTLHHIMPFRRIAWATILQLYSVLALNSDKTRFQLILPVHSQNVTKNLTGHRMHVAGPQTYQIKGRVQLPNRMNFRKSAKGGPPLFGLYPNGLFMIGLSPFGLPMTFGLSPFGLF